MTIYFEKVEGFSANTKEFRVLVEDDDVAEPITHLYFHNCRRESGRIGTRNRFQSPKRTHSAASNKVSLRSFKTRMPFSHIGIHMEDHERGLDRKVIHKLAGLCYRGVR